MSKLAVVVVVFSLSATAAAREDAAPAAARCDEPNRPVNADWQRWSRETMPIAPDGVDFSRIKKLAATEPATAERMLRLGLSLCDPIAAQAVTVTKLRALLPELRALLGRPAGAAGWCAPWARREGLPVPRRRRARGERGQSRDGLGAVPGAAAVDRDRNVRMSAAMGARRFRRDGITRALLDTVRRDKEYLVRYQAAQSLLELGDIYPRDIADHRRLFEAISGPVDGAPAARDFDRYALGARMLEKLMADRAAGKCSESVRPANIRGDVLQVNNRMVAVAVDAAESSCAKQFALVVFVEAASAGQWAVSGIETTRDPTSIELTTPSGPVVVEYSRAAATARLGGAELPKGENILVLSVGRDGRVTPRWTGRLDTRVTRGDDLVQALLQQSPALRQAVKP